MLTSPRPEDKVYVSLQVAQSWRQGKLGLKSDQELDVPDFPSRPPHPILARPRDVPKRGYSSTKGRVALLHSLAHIELNAIDLAWDLIARFSDQIENFADPVQFGTDWIKVAEEEAKHFSLLSHRLADFDAQYGDLPAHGGLWEAAHATRFDLAARLAIVPMVLEARGLDVSPSMIAALKKSGDDETARVLELIYRDEIGHVATGVRWFRTVCAHLRADPKQRFKACLERYFKGQLKGPFNLFARNQANFPSDFVDN